MDVSVDDALGKLALSDDGIRKRDDFVISTCLNRGIPIAAVVGGGYSEKERLTQKHAQLVKVAIEVWRTSRAQNSYHSTKHSKVYEQLLKNRLKHSALMLNEEFGEGEGLK